MHFLSIEPSTKVFSLAISHDAKVLRFRNLKVDKVLEDSIVPAVDKILTSAGISFKRIDGFAVGLGPGSFTSLRVGLATVKAFAMATGKPVVGIASLDVLAEGASNVPCDEICVISDARRGMVYAAIYNNAGAGSPGPKSGGGTPPLRRKTDYLLTTVENVLNHVHGRTLFVGDGVALYRDDIIRAYKKCDSKTCQALFAPQKLWYPQAKSLAKLACERFALKDYDDSERLVPLYLYAADCQVAR